MPQHISDANPGAEELATRIIEKVSNLEGVLSTEMCSNASIVVERDRLLQEKKASKHAHAVLEKSVENSQANSSKLQYSLALCSSQKDQIEQLQTELLNSALQYGEQLDAFATEMASYVKSTNSTIETQQQKATGTILQMKQAQQQQMDTLRSALALATQSNIEMKQQHSADMLKASLDFDTKLKRAQHANGNSRPSAHPQSNNTLLQRAFIQKFQVQSQNASRRESQLKARIRELEVDLDGIMGRL